MKTLSTLSLTGYELRRFLRGHLTRAAQLAAEAEALAAEEGTDEACREPAPATALAWVHLRRYTLVEAREWLGRARARERNAGAGAIGYARAGVSRAGRRQSRRARGARSRRSARRRPSPTETCR